LNDQRTLIEYLELNRGLYIEGNDWCADHRNTDLFNYFNIEFVGTSQDNTVNRLDADEDDRFGERSFGYISNDYVGNRPDYIRACENAEDIITCNQDNIRAVFYSGAYRTYAQSVSFVGMNNNRDFDRAEYLLDIINALAGYRGALSGYVVNNMSDEPVSGAVVEIVGPGLTAVTDDEGSFQIQRIPNEVFNLRITARGYTTLEAEDMDFEGERELEVELRLLHPELSLNQNEITLRLEEDDSRTIDITVSNPGDGPLDFSTSIRSEPVEGHLWEEIQGFDAGMEVEDTRLQAALFFRDYYWVAGGGSGADNPNLFYKLNRDGELVELWEQESESNYGWRDLTTDGEYIYGVDQRIITQIDPETGCATDVTIPTPCDPTCAVTWDPENDIFWVSGSTTDIYAIDRESNEIDRILNRGRFRISGLAWHEDDPDGYQLYISSIDQDREPVIDKVDCENGEVLRVINLDIGDQSLGGGEITMELLPFTWIMVIQMQGRDDWLRSYEAGSNFFWVEIDPSDGQVDPEEELDMEITISTQGLDVGVVYEAFIQFDHNTLVDGAIWIEVALSISGAIERELTVPLESGWNMISINVTPPEEMWQREEGPDIVRMTEQLRVDEDHHYIDIIKDERGRFYLPAFGFNNIEYWNLVKGYQVKVNDDVEAVWSGEPIPFDTDIPLTEGWNTVGYLPTYQLDAGAPHFYVLSSIIDHVLTAKDANGRFMLPDFNFSNMPPWRETQGYQLKVDADVVLNYPEELDEAADFYLENESLSGQWHSTVRTDVNMSVLVTSVSGFKVSSGDQITAISDDDRIVGVGSIDSDVRCGLAVWGDDPTTEVVEGLHNNEAFVLKLWSNELNKVAYLSPEAFKIGRRLTYKPDGYVVLDVSAAISVPEEFRLTQNYPNPFNNATRIMFELPEALKVSIDVLDVNGRLIDQLVSDEFDAGSHNVIWNADQVPAGIYLVQMESSGFYAVRKVVLMK